MPQDPSRISPEKFKKDKRHPQAIAQKILSTRIQIGDEDHAFGDLLDPYQILELQRWQLEETLKSDPRLLKKLEEQGAFDPDPENHPHDLQLKRALKHIASDARSKATPFDMRVIQTYLERCERDYAIIRTRIEEMEYILKDENRIAKQAKILKEDEEFTRTFLNQCVREDKLALASWSAVAEDMGILAEKIGIKREGVGGLGAD